MCECGWCGVRPPASQRTRSGNNGYRDISPISLIPGFNWISGKAVKRIICISMNEVFRGSSNVVKKNNRQIS